MFPDGVRPAALVIENGKISSVFDAHSALPSGPVEELGALAILPGAIDAHVHINEPGRTDWEGFETAGAAAAAGGVTTIVDMPLNSSPVTTTVEALRQKTTVADGKLMVDCGFYGGVVPGPLGEIKKLASAGVLGFKVFLVDSGIDEFPAVSASDLRASLPHIVKTGLPLLVHAELRHGLDGKLLEREMPGSSYDDWLASRPAEMELEAIRLIAGLSREFKCRCHIVHLACAEALPLLAKEREANPLLTVETCPHYLFFSSETLDKKSTLFKCAPPIRGKTNQDALWEGLKSGVIDFIASDHSPAPPTIKHLTDGDFKKAWGGIASLQFTLPVVWTAAKGRGFSLKALAAWLAERPASFLGLKTKGRIALGMDADLVIFNPEESVVPTADSIRFRHKISPYLGQKLSGKVVSTYLRGVKIFDSEGAGTPSEGRIIVKNY